MFWRKKAPTASAIRAANRNAVGGGPKRCRKGKNCSATCIDAGKDCLVGLPEPVSAATAKVATMLQNRRGGPPPVAIGSEQRGAGAFDKDLATAEKRGEVLRRDGDQTFDRWSETTGPEAKKLGQGLYGTVIQSPDGSYAVKRGDISDTEARLIQKLGDADLGPKLLAADVDGPAAKSTPGVENRRGRIAMSVVEGEPIGDVSSTAKVAGRNVADIYWDARANLHRMGVAHNDLHMENVLVDKNGKGRIVDMGMAQDNPKAALSEALGAFRPPKGAVIKSKKDLKLLGDQQAKRWNAAAGPLLDVAQATGNEKSLKALKDRAPLASRALANLEKVQKKMESDGLSRDEIAEVMVHGIRKDPSTYSQGVWQKIPEQKAMEYINLLYDGV